MKLPETTNKQKEILLLLYRFRFLNRIQIQKLLHHKDHKTINQWLKNLTEKNYTGRIFEKKAGINDPAIYFMSKNGIKFLKQMPSCEKEYVKKLYQENRRSRDFIDKSILIANIYLKLLDSESSSDSKLKFYTQTDFPKSGVIRDLLPSFAYIIEKKSKIEHFSCEILKDGMPRFAMRGRILKYLEFFSQDNNVNILFLCPNDSIKKYLSRFIQKQLIEENIDNLVIYLPTIDNISELGLEQSMLEEIEHY